MELEQCINSFDQSPTGRTSTIQEELARLKLLLQYAVLKCLWDENGPRRH